MWIGIKEVVLVLMNPVLEKEFVASVFDTTGV